MAKKLTPFQPPCAECKSRCCASIAVGVNSPRTTIGREDIRWFLLHENVAVYIGHDKEWYVEFRTPCAALGEKGRCGIYERRPKTCRDYGNTHGACEYFDTPYIEKFETLEEFEGWQEARRTARKSAAQKSAAKKSSKGT